MFAVYQTAVDGIHRHQTRVLLVLRRTGPTSFVLSNRSDTRHSVEDPNGVPSSKYARLKPAAVPGMRV